MGVDGSGSVSRHASERALLGFCSFHHMLLALWARYPIIGRVASDKLRRFIRGERSKAAVPNLGNLLVYVAVSDDISWDDVAAAVMDEVHVRNVLWNVRDTPKLAWDISDEERNLLTFRARRTSYRLLMFQAYFLQKVARPSQESLADTLARYNRQFGQPTQQQKEALVAATRKILQVDSWRSFYTRMGLAVPSPHHLARTLRDAMVLSAQYGYHKTLVVIGHLSSTCQKLECKVEKVGTQQSLKDAFNQFIKPALEARQDDDASSVVSGSTCASTTASKGPESSVVNRLSQLEEKDARKYEKVLREIAKLELRQKSGEKLDSKQIEKIQRRGELEDTVVMRKVRLGYARSQL